MRDFTLQASHELKTPLTVMRAHLESLHRERDHLPPEQNAWIERQLDEIARLAQIVDSLSLLTKADAGLVNLDRKIVDFSSLVMEAFENAAMLAEPRAISVVLGPATPARVVGDRHRLRQLLLILVDNAVKYNRPSGSIRLSTSVAEGWVELLITNDGDGLNAESRHRVFERFFRGDNAAGKVPGCGLGLTIARWIAFAHEGSLRLRPEPPSSTTVCLRLPVACVPRTPLLGPSGASVPGAEQAGMAPDLSPSAGAP
jgi:signal transduction histidine kinase